MPGNKSELRQSEKALGLLSLAWLACALLIVTNAGSPFLWKAILGFTFLILGGTWGLLLLVRLLTPGPRRWLGWWLVTPAALGTAVALAFSGVGLTLRVAASEGQLRAYAESVPAGTRIDQEQWVGLFVVDEVREYQGVVYLFTAREFMGRVGIAYNPTGSNDPRASEWSTYTVRGTGSGRMAIDPSRKRQRRWLSNRR